MRISGLSNYPVRIIEIEEDDNGLLAITAEELVTGVSTPEFYAERRLRQFRAEFGVPSVPVNPPLIFEPPIAATGGSRTDLGRRLGRKLRLVDAMGRRERLCLGRQRHLSQIDVITAPLRQGVSDRGTAGRPRPPGMRPTRCRST